MLYQLGTSCPKLSAGIQLRTAADTTSGFLPRDAITKRAVCTLASFVLSSVRLSCWRTVCLQQKLILLIVSFSTSLQDINLRTLTRF